MAKWNLNLENLSHGGFAPLWFRETYPSFGNKNQAGAMVNIDMTNPGFITQGPGLASLTNGTEAGVVSTLIKGMIPIAGSASLTYAVGGDKLYSMSTSTVTTDGTWPHTIDKAAVTGESGEDVIIYKAKLYYTYNNSSNGDVGQHTFGGAFDDDWGSTVPSGATALIGSGYEHQMCVGGNDVLYIGNGTYVTSYDGTTFIEQALDFPTYSRVKSLTWHKDRLWIAVDHDPVGLGTQTSSIYIWDGTTDSWETEIPLRGGIGGLIVKGGTLYVFHGMEGDASTYRLSYIDGATVVPLCSFQGGIPKYYQMSVYNDFIIFASGGLIYAYGSGDQDLPGRLFQIADGGYSTIGAVSTLGGTPTIASNQTTSYKLAKFSGYDVTSSWKSLLFDITGNGKNSRIDDIRVNFETLTSGASVALALKDNQGKTIHSDTISHSKLGAATTVWLPLNGKVAENFRVELDYAAGSTSAPVKIKNIKINGSTD